MSSLSLNRAAIYEQMPLIAYPSWKVHTRHAHIPPLQPALTSPFPRSFSDARK